MFKRSEKSEEMKTCHHLESNQGLSDAGQASLPIDHSGLFSCPLILAPTGYFRLLPLSSSYRYELITYMRYSKHPFLLFICSWVWDGINPPFQKFCRQEWLHFTMGVVPPDSYALALVTIYSEFRLRDSKTTGDKQYTLKSVS